MTQFARPPAHRMREAAGQYGSILRELLAKTAMLETGCLVTPYIGTIPAGYSSGRPTVTLSTGVTIGPLQYVSTYTPHAGDTVLLVPVGQAYVVVGAVL